MYLPENLDWSSGVATVRNIESASKEFVYFLKRSSSNVPLFYTINTFLNGTQIQAWIWLMESVLSAAEGSQFNFSIIIYLFQPSTQEVMDFSTHIPFESGH